MECSTILLRAVVMKGWQISVALLALVLPPLQRTISFAEEPLRNFIDARIEAAWQREKLTPAPLTTDAEFLRRIYLDLVGSIPTHEQAARFLDDQSADKRTRLI